MKGKVNPIWWVAGFSLLVGAVTYLILDKPTAQTSPQGDYQEQVTAAIAEITDLDAYGDMSWQPQYSTAITRLDAQCAEPLSEVLRLTYSETQRKGEEGVQFALLNEFEETVYLLDQQAQQTVQCAPLISETTN
jgi:hypothetical protein